MAHYFEFISTAKHYISWRKAKFNDDCVVINGPYDNFAVVTREFAIEEEFEIIG